MSDIKNSLLDEDLEIDSANSEKIFTFLKDFDKEVKLPVTKLPMA